MKVDPIYLSVLFAVALALIPFLLMATTSFMKLSIVLSLLRNALGTGQVPSGMVVTVLAALLSWFVMLPVQREVSVAIAPLLERVEPSAPFTGDSGRALLEIYDRGKEPFRKFMERNAGREERAFFMRLSQRARPEAERGQVREADFGVVLPAFFLTELSEAFEIVFLVLLPFLVVDLVVASILASLGMQALSAAAVALPFKLLLFVSSDGLETLIEALLAGYR